MSEQLQLRRGTDVQVAGFTGAPGEVVVATTTNRLVVQNGATPGGFPHALKTDITGGSLSGAFNALTVSATTSFAALIKTPANPSTTNTASSIVGSQGSSLRWGVQFGNANVETGGNVGSDFSVDRYNDAGNFVDSPIYVSRLSGIVVLADGLFVPVATASASPTTGAVVITGGLGVGGKVYSAGSMNVVPASNADAFFIANKTVSAPSVSNFNAHISGKMNDLFRWQIVLGDNTAETGSNAGSSFVIGRYSDTGVLIDTPFSINRANGQVVLVDGLSVPRALSSAPAIVFATDTNTGFFSPSPNYIVAVEGGSYVFGMPALTELAIFNNSPIAFDAAQGQGDSFLMRAAPGVIEVANGAAGVIGGGGTLAYPPRTPSTLASGPTPNYSMGSNVSKYQRITANPSASTLSGLTAATPQVDGQEHVIINIGTGILTLTHQDTASSVGNRFFNSTAASIALSQNQAADLFFDATSNFWRVYKRN